MKNKSINVRMDKDLYHSIKSHAKTNKMKIAEMVRIALKKFITTEHQITTHIKPVPLDDA